MAETIRKEYRPLIRAARKAGWRIVIPRTRRQAGVKMYSPDGETQITLHRTPSRGGRALENTKARLRRAGVAV